MKIINQNLDGVSAEIALEECDNPIEIGGFDRKALKKLLKSCKRDFVCLSYADIDCFDSKCHPEGKTARMLIIDEEIAIIGWEINDPD